MPIRPRMIVRRRALVVLLPAMCGCAATQPAPQPAGGQAPTRQATAQVTQEQVQSGLMSFADGFSTQVSDVLDRIQDETDDEAVRLWAIRMRLTTHVTSASIAGGPNPVVSLLDMVVFVTLRRIVAEDHWTPNLLGERAQPLLAAYRAQEQEVWSLASPILSPEQKEELKELIHEWRRDNPDQRFVAHVRFADFAAYQTRAGGERRGISSIFQLFAIDPLAGVDPIAAELRSFRLLSERFFYFTKRAPIIVSLLTEQVLADATGSPDGRRLLDSIESVSAAASSVVAQAEALPELVRAERSEAVEQLAREADRLRAGMTTDVERIVDGQRQALIDSLASEEERLARALADTRSTLAEVRAAAAAIESAAATAAGLASRIMPDQPTPEPDPENPDRPIADLRASAESIERSVRLIASILDRLDSSDAPEGGLAAIDSIRAAALTAGDQLVSKVLRAGLILIAAAGLVAVVAPLVRLSIASRLAIQPSRR